MWQFQNTRALVLLGLLVLILIVVLPLIVFLVLAEQKEHMPRRLTPTPRVSQTSGAAQSWPVISRNVPVFASSATEPASDADNDDYGDSWRSEGTPAWLAYDLSNVPASWRGKVLVVWYNETLDYDHTLIGYTANNLPQDYTIDVNPAPGGGHPPGTGWMTLVTVKGNHYHSRQHVMNMLGNNWIRINVAEVDSPSQKDNVAIKMDIYDANYGPTDDWIFYGDGITVGGMGHLAAGGVKTFAQLINAKLPNKFPLQESGGIEFLASTDGAKYIKTWLQLFPGKYVVLSYGTIDAISCVAADIFYSSYVAMVQAVLNQGKIPIIPHIPWGRNANIQKCAPALNCKIDHLYQAFPQVIKGPDFWAFFQKHQNLISNDNIDPTEMGFGAYRLQWVNAMLAAVYNIRAI